MHSHTDNTEIEQDIPSLWEAKKLSVTYRSVRELTPYKGNARTHSKAQIRKIAESIRAFGFTNPILLDASSTIMAGHGRVEAAKLLGMEELPTILLETLTPTQVRAYILADNRLALDAGWDEDMLKIELQHLVISDEIEVSVTGFEIGEIDVVLGVGMEESDEADELPEDLGAPVTQSGDVWLLGNHRVLCGDIRHESSLSALIESSISDLERKQQILLQSGLYVTGSQATNN